MAQNGKGPMTNHVEDPRHIDVAPENSIRVDTTISSRTKVYKQNVLMDYFHLEIIEMSTIPI